MDARTRPRVAVPPPAGTETSVAPLRRLRFRIPTVGDVRFVEIAAIRVT